MGIFERYLSSWVGLYIIAGGMLGNFIPEQFAWLSSLEWAYVNLVVAVLIMVFAFAPVTAFLRWVTLQPSY